MEDSKVMRKNILVLHQSVPGMSDIDKALTGFGYQVFSVSGESEAWNVLKGDQNPDLMIIEASASEREFISFLEMIRSDPALKKMPVIALIEEESLQAATGVLDAGCDVFLLKPVNHRILYKRLQELLEKNPRAYNRVLCRTAAEATSGQETLNGEIVEIGEGGAGLLLDREQAEKDILKIAFTFPRDSEELIVGVEVIHIEKCGDQYLHGVRFIIIDEQAKRMIRQFVQSGVPEERP